MPTVARGKRRKRKRQRLVLGQIPDPLRAHGVWVYLFVSILAGALSAPDPRFLPTLLIGSGCTGALVLASSLAVAGRPSALTRFFLGLLLALGSLAATLAVGRDPSFLLLGLVAVPPGLASAYFASADGFLSPGALAFGAATLASSAGMAADAAGAAPRLALTALAFLAPFYFWRTWRLARSLGRGWTRERFARRGLIESALAVAWGVVTVFTVRMIG